MYPDQIFRDIPISYDACVEFMRHTNTMPAIMNAGHYAIMNTELDARSSEVASYLTCCNEVKNSFMHVFK